MCEFGYLPIVEKRGFRLDPESGELWVEGKADSIYLPPVPRKILYYLMVNDGLICPKVKVWDYVWGGEDIGDSGNENLKKGVHRLRRSIGDKANQGGGISGIFIKTIGNEGWRFVGICNEPRRKD